MTTNNANKASAYSNGNHPSRADHHEVVCPLPVISLFSGCGGLDLGFANAGFTSILAIDANAAACRTYERNHVSTRVFKRDLSKLPRKYILERLSELSTTVKPIGIVGGPPCQAFSQGNWQKRDDDPRALLSKTYATILRELNDACDLDFFVFENVLGLRQDRHDEQFKQIKRLFSAAGFRIFESELNAQNFGVAQVRRRLFVVGLNRYKYPNISFTFPTQNGAPKRSVRDLIAELPAPLFFKRGTSVTDIPHHPNHWCMVPRSDRFFNGSLKEGEIKGRPFRVLKWDAPSWTVAYGNREVHIHPSATRRLSVYEAMLLQGFPPEYELCGTLSDQIRLVSDAVPPPLAEALANSLIDALGYDRATTANSACSIRA
ncbi:DNA cytosine methyltransferase [Alloacidobacterium dinghuense]|uniref:DNA (cytosine-5-)-methyltransferase n=1 Tax=Alloacidobacterium dinghuense TaxID=2763107 RepID=A0A7G8BE59_9BACT|nr:DNA cytosine methyltransferase [Alloacidobacterium dinghuense]QNI30829.1 DNA cytosine methyltransferase [Alloacidobacterium dinghuense]